MSTGCTKLCKKIFELEDECLKEIVIRRES